MKFTRYTDISHPSFVPRALSSFMKNRSKHPFSCIVYIKTPLAFTLVELIVVITILVILGTLAFTQLASFAGSARDSTRISNLTNLEKSLALFQINSGTYPLPEGPVNITASGDTNIIGYQGFVKDQIRRMVKLSSGGSQDPLDATLMTTYRVNKNQSKMQLMIFLEDRNILTTFIQNASANIASDYSKRYPYLSGDALGIFLSIATGSLNQPVQESGSAVDVVSTNTGYLVIFGNNITDRISGTGIKLSDLQDEESLQAYRAFQDLKTYASAKKVLILVTPTNPAEKILELKFKNLGYNVTINTGATTLAQVAAYSPDIVVCDFHAWGCDMPIFSTLYDNGYAIVTQGNDTTFGYPIATVSPRSSSIPTHTVFPDRIDHYLGRGWNSTQNLVDNAWDITRISDKAISVGKDIISGYTQIVYLEEPSKGRWIHYQLIGSVNDDLFERANAYLLR